MRPLRLGNTDAKLLPALVHIPLAKVASENVIDIQTGIIKGRSLTSNIISIETHALAATATPDIKNSIMMFYDFAVAFPSIAHHWIYFVLECMRLPSPLVRVIAKLYENCACQICI